MDFSKLIGAALGGSNNQAAGGGASAIAGLVGSMLGGKQGAALGGIVGTLMQNGLGEQVQSWLGQGKNEKVTAEQIQQSLSSDQIKEMATAAGVSEDQAAGLISKVLPTVVDKVSPEGEIKVDEKTAESAVSGLDVGSIINGLGGLLGDATKK